MLYGSQAVGYFSCGFPTLCTHAADKPSWTAKLLADPELLCKKVREEAGELCQTLEQGEGRERAASEAADLFYHAMVLLNAQVGLGCVWQVGWHGFGIRW